ncbi:MAG: STAS domain-containing protein [Acidobacteriota bacterium]
MQVESTVKDGVAVVMPSGVIDTRTAVAFESTLVRAFADGTRSFAIDFSRVDLITSAGIRVLVMMVHRLRGTGGLALFGMNDRVRTVFEIGGLLQQFRVAANEAEALALLARPVDQARPDERPRPSKIASVVLDLVSRDLVIRDLPAAGGELSPLAKAVAGTLARWSGDPPA